MTQTQENQFQFQLVNYVVRTFTQQELLDLQSKGVLFNYANKHDLSEVSPCTWYFTGADAGVLCEEYNVVENEENIKLFLQLIGEAKENQMQYTFKPGDKVTITVPEGTLAGEREPGGEYIAKDMLDWTEGYIDRDDAEVSERNSIRVFNPDGYDHWCFPVSWLKLKEEPAKEDKKKLPDSFSFKTSLHSDYKAVWNESGGYFSISWHDGASSTTYCKDEVESYVERGYWTIIEEVKVQPVEQSNEDAQEQEITLESLDKQIQEAQTNLNHLEYLREVFLSARDLGYKLTKV